jgi:hypothetical protein
LHYAFKTFAYTHDQHAALLPGLIYRAMPAFALRRMLVRCMAKTRLPRPFVTSSPALLNRLSNILSIPYRVAL